MKITLTINGQKGQFDIPVATTLMEFLKSQRLWSVRHGCENGECGNCAVIVDGKAVNSCNMLVVQTDGKHIETYESLRNSNEYTVLKEAFMDFGDIECGFCIPGMMIAMKALLDKIPDPTEEELMDTLAGNHCFCTKSVKPIDAICQAVKKMRGHY